LAVQAASTVDANRQRLLGALFSRHYRRVALWCLRFAGNRETAADLTQEIFIKVQRSLPAFAGNAKFSTWLFAVTRNHCISYSQKQSAKPEVELDVDFPDSATNAGPEAGIDAGRQIRQAELWIAELLEERERTVFLLHYREGVPLDAISRLLGLTNVSGAKAYIVSARRKLSEAARRWKERQ
jgi:RNA polymerase sigma-70 factor, ECF subfamily